MSRYEIDTYPYLDITPYIVDVDGMVEQVEREGLAAVDLSVPVDADRMLSLASILGSPMPEHDKSIQSNVIGGSVLRLVTVYDQGADHTLQPFSADELTMHMERSMAPLSDQPSHLILGCIVPPRPDAGGQTIINDMKNIFRVLTQDEQDVLSESRQRLLNNGRPSVVSANTIIAEYGNRKYFSFRDAGEYGDDWDLESSVGNDMLAGIVHKMYNQLYKTSNIRAVPWEEGRVIIIDNRRFFHARTAQISPTDRELLRVRIQTPQEI